MHTVTDFIRLMVEYELDRCDKRTPGLAGIIDVPVMDKFFTGDDASGRVFANLPIVIKHTDGRKTTDTIVIYQRYKNCQDRFVIGGGPIYLADSSLLGAHYNDLGNLEKLLDGKTIQLFYNGDTNQTQFTLRLDLPSLFQIITHVVKATFAWRTTPAA
jgi:hypothetical protein